MTLGIVTAFRAKALARDWNYHACLLARTLDSILANAGDLFIVVACHEIPDLPHAHHPKIEFLPIDAPVPTRMNDDMCVDKVIKLSWGAQYAIAQGCDYVMFVDADDLLHRDVSTFVESNAGAPGWSVNALYSYQYGRSFMHLCSKPKPWCAPCVIVRSDLLDFDNPPAWGSWSTLVQTEHAYLRLLAVRDRPVNTLAAVGHENYNRLCELAGYPLEPLPFAPLMMISHPDSTSQVPGGLGSAVPPDHITAQPRWRRIASKIKQQILSTPELRPVTPQVRRAFSVVSPPASYSTAPSFAGVDRSRSSLR